MSESVTYYNTEYAPVADQYREAEERAAELNNQGTISSRESSGENPEIQTRKRTPKKRRSSRYDEDMYALPEDAIEEDATSPPSTVPPSSRELLVWKVIAVISSLVVLLGFGAVITLFVYVVPTPKGWFILQYWFCFTLTYLIGISILHTNVHAFFFRFSLPGRYSISASSEEDRISSLENKILNLEKIIAGKGTQGKHFDRVLLKGQ